MDGSDAFWYASTGVQLNLFCEIFTSPLLKIPFPGSLGKGFPLGEEMKKGAWIFWGVRNWKTGFFLRITEIIIHFHRFNVFSVRKLISVICMMNLNGSRWLYKWQKLNHPNLLNRGSPFESSVQMTEIKPPCSPERGYIAGLPHAAKILKLSWSKSNLQCCQGGRGVLLRFPDSEESSAMKVTRHGRVWTFLTRGEGKGLSVFAYQNGEEYEMGCCIVQKVGNSGPIDVTCSARYCSN